MFAWVSKRETSQKLGKWSGLLPTAGLRDQFTRRASSSGGTSSTLVRSAASTRSNSLTTVDSSQGSVRSFRSSLDNASLACLDRDRSPRSQRRCHYRRLKHHEVQDMTIGEL